MAAHRKNTNRKITSKKVIAAAGIGIGIGLITAIPANASPDTSVRAQSGSEVREDGLIFGASLRSDGEQPLATQTGTYPKDSSAQSYLGYHEKHSFMAVPQVRAGD